VFILGQQVYTALSGRCRHRTIVFQLNFNCRFLFPKTVMFKAVIYELITLNGDGLTNEPFLRRPNDRFKWTKPLWKKKDSLHSSRASKPLRTGLTDEEEEEIPPVESEEWKQAMQAFSKLSDSHKSTLMEAIANKESQNDRVTKRRKPSRIPTTIEEVEEDDTYDPNHFTTLDPIVNPTTRHIGRSIKAAKPSHHYDAATAHFRIGFLRNTILGEPKDQELTDFWDEGLVHTSTPRKHQKSTLLEKAVPLSPPYSDISVHSRTFRVPNSPAMSEDFERHFGRDKSGNIRSTRTPRQEEADQPRTPRRTYGQRQDPPDPSDDEDDGESSDSDSTYR